MTSVLSAEKKYLTSNRDALLREYGSRFLVIKGTSVLSAHDTYEEAVAAATDHRDPGPFLVRSAENIEDDVVTIPALSLGILSHAGIEFRINK